jgi:mycothiol synthase
MSLTVNKAVGEQISYHIRPTRPDEARALAEFVTELGRLEPTGDSNGLEDYVEWFSSPISLEYTRWQANLVNPDGSEGAMIGRAAVRPANLDGSSFGMVEVHPDYRNRGVGRALFDLVEQQALALGVKTLHIESNQRHTLLREFLERRGFEFDRYSWEMLLPPTHPVPAAQWPSGFSVRSFVPGQDEQLYHHTINAAFVDHFAVNYVPLEHILYAMQQPSFNPDGVLFAFAGEDVAGICVAAVRATAEGEGWIDDLAVIPAYRRHGVGRALLLTGVNWLHQRVSKVKLGVEGKNEKALPLYISVGFQQHDGQFIMTKQLG